MEQVQIEVVSGQEAEPLVDPFYTKFGSSGRARPNDLFFLAKRQGELVGCVRFCVEENTPMLRTMMIDEALRRHGIGLQILNYFVEHLQRNKIHNVFCIANRPLEGFYGSIGFKKIDPKELPSFLQERMSTYTTKGMDTIGMMRS
jgi:N-acetylglutamate synthase-like GNAT family acetyltransferase